MSDRKIEIVSNGVDYANRFDFFLDSFDVPTHLNSENSGTVLLDFYNHIADIHLKKLCFALTGKNHGKNINKILNENFDISLSGDINTLMEVRRKFAHEFVSDRNLSTVELDRKIYNSCAYDQVKNPNYAGLNSGFEDYAITKIEEYYLGISDKYLNKFVKALESEGFVFICRDQYFKEISECIRGGLQICCKQRDKFKKRCQKIYKEVYSRSKVSFVEE